MFYHCLSARKRKLAASHLSDCMGLVLISKWDGRKQRTGDYRGRRSREGLGGDAPKKKNKERGGKRREVSALRIQGKEKGGRKEKFWEKINEMLWAAAAVKIAPELLGGETLIEHRRGNSGMDKQKKTSLNCHAP